MPKTLQEWAAQYNVQPIHPTYDGQAARIIYNWNNDEQYRALFNLTDYIVSTVAGIVIYLSPK